MTGQENKKINMSDFNSQIGKWKIFLYDYGSGSVILTNTISGILVVDNIKYAIKDSVSGEPIFVAPSGNVAFVVNLDKI